MYIVPAYFQAMMNASTGIAGTAMVPAVIGNTVGGLLTGYIIKKYDSQEGLRCKY